MKKHDILFIVDEVICAFGRLGTTFGCDKYNIKPDLVSIAKDASLKLPDDQPVKEKDAERVIGAELRNDPELTVHPGGVATSMATAAEPLVLIANLDSSDKIPHEYSTPVGIQESVSLYGYQSIPEVPTLAAAAIS